LFAREEYQPAAAALYAVLAVSPGWDWTTLSSLYGDQEEFPRQLRGLEAAGRQNPNSAVLAFLRGYHYTTGRHFDAGVKEFQTAGKLLPGDDLIPALAVLISGGIEKTAHDAEAAAPTSPASIQPASSRRASDHKSPMIEKLKLVGDWTAHRGGTVKIE